MKIAIAQCGQARSGKTTTIRAFAAELRSRYPGAKIIETLGRRKDQRLIIKIGGKLVGIESGGDPGSARQEESLDVFVSRGCSLIICACRSRGRTKARVRGLEQKGYKVELRKRDPAPAARRAITNATEIHYMLTQVERVFGAP